MHAIQSAMSCKSMSLCELKPGQRAYIYDLSNTHAAVCHRLRDLGIMEGTHVELKRTHLFGGPLMLKANGLLFGIRQDEARSIGVHRG